MKVKLLTNLLVMCIAASLIGVSFANFSDTETSTGNVMQAGTLDLKVDGQDDPNVAHIDVSCMKPGQTVYQYWVLKNVGCIDGKLSIQFANIVNNENSYLEPEITAGDTTPGTGELGGFLYVLMKWRQPAGTGTWREIYMVPYGHTFINHLSGPYYGGECSPPNAGIDMPVLGQDDEVEIELRLWWHPRTDDNRAQSDSVSFDVVFALTQA